MALCGQMIQSPRVVALFDLANTMVALAGKGEPTIPQSLHDITVIGKGTAEDRAWVFAELLRQGGIDAVILRPHSPASEAPAAAGAPERRKPARSADPVIGGRGNRRERLRTGDSLACGCCGRKAGLSL